MCPVSEEQRLNIIPTVLSGDALIYYLANVQGCSIQDEAVTLLPVGYNHLNREARTPTKRSPYVSEKS